MRGVVWKWGIPYTLKLNMLVGHLMNLRNHGSYDQSWALFLEAPYFHIRTCVSMMWKRWCSFQTNLQMFHCSAFYRGSLQFLSTKTYTKSRSNCMVQNTQTWEEEHMLGESSISLLMSFSITSDVSLHCLHQVFSIPKKETESKHIMTNTCSIIWGVLKIETPPIAGWFTMENPQSS